MESKPRQLVVHASINRPHLILGGDRELVLCSALLCLCLAYATFTTADFKRLITYLGPLAAVLLWAGSVALFRRMAKADPMLRQAFLRHLRYGDYYPARSGIAAEATSLPRTWTGGRF